jgi:hypothetical protein
MNNSDDPHAGNPLWRFTITDPGEDTQHLHALGNGVQIVAGRGIGPSARRMQVETARSRCADAVGGGFDPWAHAKALLANRWG